MTRVAQAAPYWRLSAYYFVYFTTLGALLPYWSLYLQQRGFNAADIGRLMAIIAATKIIAPYIWGWLADHSGNRLSLIRRGSLAAAVCFAGVFAADSLPLMALVMLLYTFFWNAGLPQFEATTLYFLGRDTHHYSRIRLWGSVGFIVAVLITGPVLDRAGVAWLPWLLLPLFALIWLSTLHVPNNESLEARPQQRQSVWPVVQQPVVLVILAISFLMQAGFGAYYAFFSIFLESHGYSKSLVGCYWAIGVVAEIGIFFNMHRLLQRFGARRLLLFCFLVTALRWWLTGRYVEYRGVIVVTQTLHAFSFGMYHAVLMYLIHRHFAGSLHGRGQALYSSLSFGAGGALGTFGAGYCWQNFGGEMTFAVAGGVVACGLLLAWLALPDETMRPAGQVFRTSGRET